MAAKPQLHRLTCGNDLHSSFPEFAGAVREPPGRFALQASAAAARLIAPAWPEVLFTGGRAAPRAVLGGRAAVNALVFAPGLLRFPTATARPWSSIAIAATWRHGAPGLGLGERLRADAVRGEAVARAVIANRLGGGPIAKLAPDASRALSGAAVLVEGPDLRADLLALACCGGKVAVLVRARRGTLARAARAAGAAVLLLDSVSAWAVIDAAGSVQGPASHDIVVLAQLAGIGPVGRTRGQAADAFLVQGTRYIDPADAAPLGCDAFIDRLMAWRGLRARVPAIACFAGISFWKRRRMAEFAGGPVRFAHTASHAVALAAQAGGAVAVWPSRAPAGLDAAAAAAGVPLFRVEDGFLRSRGLGADFIPPASIIMDGSGIYYDARQPSDLEALLATTAFDPALTERAARLRQALVARRITKYNLGGAAPVLILPAGRRSILVPGQVADDLSVRTGGAGVSPGLALLAAVRARHPDACVLYKPHPDVEAGHRPGAVPDAAVLAYADVIVRDAAMDALIGAVDEIHTVTSLAGFEALLRGRAVTTYGRPFYAGWGLTTDVYPPERRGRRLTLDQLVAGTLILYPHYIDPLTGLLCTPEQLIDRLDTATPRRVGGLTALRRGQGALRRAFHVYLIQAFTARSLPANQAYRTAEPAC